MKKKIYILPIFLFAFNIFLFGQDKKQKTEKENILYQYFTNSQFALDKGRDNDAINILLELNKIIPDNSNVLYKIGSIYVNYPIYPNDKAKAYPFLEKSLKNISIDYEGEYLDTTAPIHAYYYLAESYLTANKIAEAAETSRKFYVYAEQYWGPAYYSEIKKEDIMTRAEKQKTIIENAQKLIANPLKVKLHRLGPTINTSFNEYNAFITPDNKIIYTARNILNSDSVVGKRGDYSIAAFVDSLSENIYSVDYDRSTKKCSLPVALFNSSIKNISIVGLSSDGKSMLIYKSDVGNGDLFVSEFNNDKWSDPVSLGNSINGSKSCESHACFSPDKNTIYFSSTRKGGFGGLDIWYSTRGAGNSWSKPENMGPSINTPFDDVAPLISNDGNTLFFSSEGHNTMGGLDIFSCTQTGQNKWSDPVNIGYPLNTTDDNIILSTSTDGLISFLSARPTKNGLGDLDIFEVTYLSKLPQLALNGKVKDAETKKPLGAKILFLSDDKKDTLANFNNNDSTGTFSQNIPKTGETIYLLASAENYQPYSKEINTSQNIIDNKINLDDIELIPISKKEIAVDNTKKQTPDNSNKPKKEVPIIADNKIKENVIKPEGGDQEIIKLKNIYYDYNKATLRPASTKELERLLKFLNNHPTLKIEISSHCDSIGSKKYNYDLSNRRAKAVVNYLTSKGIDSKRLTYKGYGKDVPVATNSTVEGRQLNRRSEFKIIEK